MRFPTEPPVGEPTPEAPRPEQDDEAAPGIWPWLAFGVLVLCWLAEAALCGA